MSEQKDINSSSSANNSRVALTLELEEKKINIHNKIDFLKNNFNNRIRIKNQLLKEFYAETFGTFVMLAFGLGSVAQFKFSKKDDVNDATSVLSINLAFGFAVTFSVLIFGKISGAHLNPAVSFAMLITKRMKILQFLVFCIGQFLGAFLAALLVFLVYYDRLKSFEKTLSLETAGIFATYPNSSLSSLGGFFDQVTGTFFLIVIIMSLGDSKNCSLIDGFGPLLVGFAVTLIGLSFGYNSGYAINPARDLGPRFFTLVAGWGSQVFSAGNYFFWIPIVGPFVGSVLAVTFYFVFVSNNWQK